MTSIERRTDCDGFEYKRFPNQCGDCQTDGHYLCGGCKNIASFNDMELSDNRLRYYPIQEKAAQEEERKHFEMKRQALIERAERLKRMSFKK